MIILRFCGGAEHVARHGQQGSTKALMWCDTTARSPTSEEVPVYLKTLCVYHYFEFLFDFVCFSDDYLVRVKAQVMTRDDCTGCWMPMGGGGMSIVGLRKLVVSGTDDIRHEYLIHGQRIADQSVSQNLIRNYLCVKA